jgi:transcriptional adapter 2-alpha
MPLRGDFDVEYDNEAELFLAEMEFMEGDDATEIDLKKKILEIYNKRLDERVKRKNFVIERGLLDLKKQNHLERSRSSEEKEIYNLMKIFARFQTEDEHERLVQNIVKERNLRRRIEELKAYKELNLKTFEEVEV